MQKELSEFYVAVCNSDGRMGKCKACVKRRVRENRRERLEQYARYERARANLPHRVEARRKYQEEHKEQIDEYKKRWRRENAQMVARRSREQYERHKHEIVARSKKWAEDNPEKVSNAKADNRRKRRAAKHASLGSFTAEEFEVLCERYGDRCLTCGRTEIRLEADHVVPLTRGGSHDISNIQPLCGTCNRRKFVGIVAYRVTADIPF